ncbi:alpha-(1,3)-fucosyltransferase 10-like [Pectinophora gossypiella]|uniref:alpha-(1,3)-fucosyltransferase 10-like n=1 Tax=Pectinophora gossypiella TaxID=13191 RepID=UPI00214E79FF|nr:alpha-(1,3)-fucosyltransferase 10-like [Pectinophora gossypiella]
MSDCQICPRHHVTVPAKSAVKSRAQMNKTRFQKYAWLVYKIAGIIFTVIVFFAIMMWFNFEYVLNQEQNASSPKNNTPESFRLPAIVWHTADFFSTPTNRKITCTKGSKTFQCELFRPQSKPDKTEGYLFDGAQIDYLPLPRGYTVWGLIHFESPSTKLMFYHEKALSLFNFSATFSRFSNIPMPLFWFKSLDDIVSPFYYVKTEKKNSMLSEIAPVLYLQSNCYTSVERDAYVKKLMDHIKIDSYGTCLHNKELYLNRMYRDSFQYHLESQELLRFIANYKFMITIENAVCNDYVTEKFWRAIQVGTVPIYYGSPLIRDWLPNNKSAILLEDFPTPELLSQHLHYLLNNDTAYEEHLEHMTLGIITNQKLIDEITVRPYQVELDKIKRNLECIVCERLHENSTRIDIVTKKHYDCPTPPSALTLSVNPNNPKLEYINKAKKDLEKILEELRSQNSTHRSSKVSWW